MSLYHYFTRRFIFQNYRDYIAVGIVSSYIAGSYVRKMSADDDNAFTLQKVYTHDESDQMYKETTNRTDGAVRREHALRYAERIRKIRAEREREAQLDAFNYLFGKNLEL